MRHRLQTLDDLTFETMHNGDDVREMKRVRSSDGAVALFRRTYRPSHHQ